MSLSQTLIDLNERIGKAKDAGNMDEYNRVGKEANDLLFAELAKSGFTREDAGRAIFCTDAYKNKEATLLPLFLGQYAGTRAEFPLLTECSKQLYTYILEGIELALKMNAALGFDFFGHFSTGGNQWRQELDELQAKILADINEGQARFDNEKDELETILLNSQANSDGYTGKTPTSVIALSHMNRNEVVGFIALMSTFAIRTKNKGMASDVNELVEQWMQRAADADRLMREAKPGMDLKLVNPIQAIGFGLMKGAMTRIANGKPLTTTIEA